LGKFHSKAADAEIAPKLLTKQHLDVRFVINHENKQCHIQPPALLLSSADKLHEMEKLNVTRVTSARAWPLAIA